MIIYNIIRAFIILVVVGAGSNAICFEMKNVVAELKHDFGGSLVFLINPKESDAIFSKYENNIEKYESAFREVLNNRSSNYKDETIFYVINAISIAKEREFFEDVRRVSTGNSKLGDVVHFYYYRIDHEEEKNLLALKRKLDFLIMNPSDSHLITFLPFFDDIDLSLQYLNKLSSRSDGAMSELIHWAIDYMHYKYKNNKEKAQKIEESYVYQTYISGNKP